MNALLSLVLAPIVLCVSGSPNYKAMLIELKKCKELLDGHEFSKERDVLLKFGSFDDAYTWFITESSLPYTPTVKSAVKNLTKFGNLSPLEYASARRLVARYLYEVLRDPSVSVKQLVDESLNEKKYIKKTVVDTLPPHPTNDSPKNK